MRKAYQKGFTIIELIVAISIIVILLSFIVPMTGKAKNKARVAKAKAEIAALETSLSAYYVDMGTYPTDTPANPYESSNSVIIKHLSGKTNGTGNYISSIVSDDNWNGPYMEFDTEDILEGEFVDPWRNAYNITVALDSVIDDGNPPINNAFSFDISSDGPTADAGDDITNY